VEIEGNAIERSDFASASPEGLPVACGQQRRGRLVLAVDRAETVDDPRVRKIVATGDDRLTRTNRGVYPRLALEPGAGPAVQRPGDPSARAQRRVRRVHHRLEALLARDVARYQFDPDGTDLQFCHAPSPVFESILRQTDHCRSAPGTDVPLHHRALSGGSVERPRPRHYYYGEAVRPPLFH
jgi:hypothetical protein